MVDFSRDFWISETETGQKVALLHDRYMMMMIMMIMIKHDFLPNRENNMSFMKVNRYAL